MHRDIKPENILISKTGEIKIADLGLACSIDKNMYTKYISTRWYRAPEMLLKTENYNEKIDIFAFGCVLAELLLMKPLFKGENEID